MAAIDFPASPTTGQIFSAANGVTYQWNGTLWLALPVPVPPYMRLYDEQVLAAPASTMSVTVPTNAKAIEIWFATNNVGNANDTAGLLLNDMQGASVNTGTNHNAQVVFGTASTAGAAVVGSANSWGLGGAQSFYLGVLKVQIFGPSMTPYINADFMCVNAAGTMIKQQYAYIGGLTATTGFRLANGSGTNMTAGSYMRCIAVY